MTILGGDEREVILGESLSKENFTVQYVGFEKYPGPVVLKNKDLDESLASAYVTIVPLSGIDEHGKILTSFSLEEIILTFNKLEKLKSGSLFIAGSMPAKVKKYLVSRKIKVIESADEDELAYLNAVPTAEGALQMAMEHSKITLYKSNCAVLGFGRCAKALALRLGALGSNVSIVARDFSSLYEAELYGYKQINIKDFVSRAVDFDFIFNTIPAPVLTEDSIKNLNKETLLFDLASKPGGIDFLAAKKYSIQFLHVLGLPGKVAPVSVGKILFQVYLPKILTHLKRGNLKLGGEEL